MYDSKKLEAIKEHLIKKQLTLAVAESVTSGHLQVAFSLATDARKYFQGGITVYNAGQKSRHLKVDPIHALEYNSVSEKVAQTMAFNVTELFSSNLGIGITGYAAPVPEKNIVDLFAWFAIVKDKQLLICEKLESAKKEPLDVQLDYTKQVIEKTLAMLANSP